MVYLFILSSSFPILFFPLYPPSLLSSSSCLRCLSRALFSRKLSSLFLSLYQPLLSTVLLILPSSLFLIPLPPAFSLLGSFSSLACPFLSQCHPPFLCYTTHLSLHCSGSSSLPGISALITGLRATAHPPGFVLQGTGAFLSWAR